MIKKYKEFDKIFENVKYHEQYLEISEKVIELIKKQNSLVDDVEDIFYEVLDIIGHDIIPSYKFGGTEYHSKEWESRFGQEIDYIEDEKQLTLIMSDLDEMNNEYTEIVITYQPPCEVNNWTPAKLDDNLKAAIKSLEERYSSLHCILEYKSSTLNMQNGDKGIWTISIIVPVKTDFSELLETLVPNKILKDFKEFCIKYNLNSDGRFELARLLRR